MRPPVNRPSPPMRRPRAKVTVYGAVLLAALASYLNGLHGDFVHDDIPAITQNKDVLGLNPVLDVFRNDFWGTPMSDVNSHKSYRPLTTLTFRANYLLWGLQPLWFHLMNLVLHTIASLLFTKVCLHVVKLQPGFACFAGLIFAAHPVHTEAVTGIVGRADVLACVFFLLSFLAYHGRGNQLPNDIWLSVLLGGVSMLAKETGITVLLLNLLYDLYRSWNAIRRSVLEVRWHEETLHLSRRAAKLLMSMSLLLMLRLALLQGSLPKFSNQDNPAAFHPCRHVRFLTFCYLAAFNCWLLLCPVTLSHDWQMGSVPLVTSLADTRNLGTFLFFVCCLIIAYRGLADFEQQRHSPLVLGCLLLVLPFLPAANLAVTVGFVVAERVLYIPSLGFVLLVVYGAQLLWAAFLRQRSLLLCVGLVVLLVLCTRTVVRNKDWSCRETLIMAGLKALPHNAKMHYNFANFQRDSSSLELATSHYKEALKLWPTYASAHNNLGTLMTGTDEAESHFLAAIRYSPNHVNAHYNLGQVYRKENRSEEAIRMLERCIRLDPAYTPAYLLLARLYSNRGVHEAVGQLLRHVVTLEPESSDHMAEYATWLRDRRRSWEALKYFYKALAFSSTHQISLLGAAKILRSKGQWPRIHQLMIRYHIISRDHKGGVVYTGDLYIRKWRDETMPYNGGESDSASSARRSSGSQQNSLSQCAKKSWQPSRPATSENFRPKSPRRKIRPWRRPLVNRTLVLRPGNIPETSCGLAGDLSTTRQDEGTRSTGTAAFNQGYHYSYWSQEQLYIPGETAVHLPVDAPFSLSGERDLCCMGSFPDATTDDEFSPDFMTG